MVHTFETWIDSQIRLLEFLSDDAANPLPHDQRRFTLEVSKLLQLYPNFQALNWVDSDWTIRWVVPLEGNEAALNQNLREHPNSAVPTAIREAIETDQTCRTSVIDLLQGGKGFATYRAVHNASGELVGFLNGVFRIDRIAALCTDQPRLRETFRFMLLSGEGDEIYRHGEPDEILRSPFLHETTLTVVNRPWSLAIAPSPQHLRSLLNPINNLLLALSILLSGIFATMLGMHLRRNKRVRISEEKYRLLVENQTDMLSKITAEGEILFASPSLCRMIGKTESDLSQATFLSFVPVDDRDRVRTEIDKLKHPPHSVYIEHRAMTKEGLRWQGWQNTAVLDDQGQIMEIVAVGRDITDQKEAQLELARSEERFRNLVEQASDAFFVCDAAGCIREVNDQACRNLGYTREELLRMHITEVALNVSRETVESNYASIEAHKPLRKESIHYRKDGTSFPVEVSIGLLETGKDRMYLAIARDITERKRAEEQKRELDLQIQQMQKLESLGVLAGGVAHDFNNILLAIIGNADLAVDELADSSEAKGYIEEIQTAASRAAELCRQMLAYSGRGKFVIHRIDVHETIEKMSSILYTGVSKKARLTFEFPSDPPLIEADPGQFRQIMINLVTNASEALEDQPGSICVTVGAAHLDRASLNEMLLGEHLEEGEYVFIEVKDDGCGMDADVREKLFDPFFSTKFTGRGLGMAAVHGIVRGHGGALRVESEPGVGTSITLYLPALQDSNENRGAKAPTDGLSEPPDTVLVVDDEEIVRTMASKMLARMGFQTLVASEGWEAIRLYEKYGSEIGCVLLDLRMPGIDGEETFSRLKELDPEVRVLFSSGHTELDLRNKKYEGEHHGFLPKPYQYSVLETQVRSVMNTPRTQARS